MADDSFPTLSPAPAATLPRFSDFALTPQEARARASAKAGPVETLFFEGDHRPAHKWVHYLPFYDRVFASFRGYPIRMLEIGVSKGGSLDVWRSYFGPEATIFGIDVDPACAGRVSPPNQVRIGSQADPAFLRRVVREMGGLEVVLDDGSHVASDQRASFQTLWPLLSPGGLYQIEDLHTAYWPGYEGGLGRPGTAIELVKDLIDDMHAWHHGQPTKVVPRGEVGSFMLVDSVVAIKKAGRNQKPGHIELGR
jgi:hypothetical protein